MSANTASIDRAFRIRSIFRSLLRQSRQFASYNFREYAKRRTKDMFRQHQGVTDQTKMENLMKEATVGLQILKRQTAISQFFQLDRLVVEGQRTGKQTGHEGDIVRQVSDQGS